MLDADTAICLIAVVAAVGAFIFMGGKECVKEFWTEFKKDFFK